jgi:hypothetical protein
MSYKGIARRLTMALLACGMAALVHAGCPADSSAKIKDGAQTGFFLGGGGLRMVGKANTVLNDNGIPGLSKYYASFGFGHTTRIGRLITTAEIMGTASNRWVSDGETSELDAAYGLWNIGFDVVKVPAFNLYPLVGLGGGVLNLIARADTKSFSDLAAVNNYPLNLWQGVFLLNAGLGADVIFPTHDRHAFTLGIRAGYLFDPNSGPVWYQDGVKITGGPAPDLSGVYVKLVIGSTGPLTWGHHARMNCASGCTEATQKM